MTCWGMGCGDTSSEPLAASGLDAELPALSDRVPRGGDLRDHLARLDQMGRVVLGGAGEDQPPRMTVDGGERGGNVAALVIVQAAFEAVQDGERARLALAALGEVGQAA